MVGGGQNRLRDTLGQLAQVTLLRRSHSTPSDRITFQSHLALSISTRIPLLNDPKHIKTGPLQSPTNRTGTGTSVTGAGESR